MLLEILKEAEQSEYTTQSRIEHLSMVASNMPKGELNNSILAANVAGTKPLVSNEQDKIFVDEEDGAPSSL